MAKSISFCWELRGFFFLKIYHVMERNYLKNLSCDILLFIEFQLIKKFSFHVQKIKNLQKTTQFFYFTFDFVIIKNIKK